MASVHITKAAVSTTYMFVQYVEILAAMSDSTDVLNLLNALPSERQNINLGIKNVVGFENATNYVLDNAEAKGFTPKYCSVSVQRFPVLEIVVYDTPCPTKFFPAIHAEFAEKYYADPPPNTIPVFLAGNTGENAIPVVMIRRRTKVESTNLNSAQPANLQDTDVEFEQPVEQPVDQLDERPDQHDNIASTRFESLD